MGTHVTGEGPTMQVWTAVPVSSPGDQKQRYDTDLPLAALLVDKWESISIVVIISYRALTPPSPCTHPSLLAFLFFTDGILPINGSSYLAVGPFNFYV